MHDIGLGDGLVYEPHAMQVWGHECESPHPHKAKEGSKHCNLSTTTARW